MSGKGLFNRKSRDDDDTQYLYITVDETGDLGTSRKRNRYYIIAGCAVNDREAFEAVARKYAKKKKKNEVKFHDDVDIRLDMIKDARPYVDYVYYAPYKKDPRLHNNPDSGLNAEGRKAIHKKMLLTTADRIILDRNADTYDVEIDRTTMISDSEAKSTFEDNEYLSETGAICIVDIMDSKEDPGLQTNDFFVGAVGYSINGPPNPGPDDPPMNTYVSLFKRKLRKVYLRNRRRSNEH